MQKTYNCPVCKDNSWKKIEKYYYSRDDLLKKKYSRYSGLLRKINIAVRALFFAKPRKKTAHCDVLSSYRKLRREVLFNVWFKQENELYLVSTYCNTCGFTCYFPRPDDNDMAEKYAYLKQYEPDIGGQSGHDQYAKNLDKKRADRVYSKCSSYKSRRQGDVLDYGGGNGKLMMPFLENKYKCHLIDYNDNPLPGVSKIGDDINSYQGNKKFDVILCSHVLEHVSEISKLVNQLKALLKPEGIIYAEIPLEIWAGLEIDSDPVTHINYFTENSFVNLFIANGFEVLEKKTQIGNWGGTYMEVTWVVVKPNSNGASSLLDPDTEKMLFPSRIDSFVKLYRILLEPRLRKIIER